MPESPLFTGRAVPPAGTHMMNTRRERAAIAAMAALSNMGANPLPTHRLPSGLGYIAPDTGHVHGPTVELFSHRPGCDCHPDDAGPCYG